MATIKFKGEQGEKISKIQNTQQQLMLKIQNDLLEILKDEREKLKIEKDNVKYTGARSSADLVRLSSRVKMIKEICEKFGVI